MKITQADRDAARTEQAHSKMSEDAKTKLRAIGEIHRRNEEADSPQ